MKVKSAAWMVEWLGASWLRGWMRTTRPVVLAPDWVKPRRAARPFIYSIWHENILTPVYVFAHSRIAALISEHRDGEYIARIVSRFGFRPVRGSTTRGGGRALRELVRVARQWHIAITPDGPRGPRRVLKEGVAFLAQVTGMPVVAVGFAYSACWRVRSWDRFVLPRPGATIIVRASAPIQITRQMNLGYARRLLQHAMDRVQEEAEQIAAGRPRTIPADGGRRDAVANAA